MIRFIDMTNGYWLFPEDKLGPFAFIDTVIDTFVTVAGEQFWDDAEHFEEACTRAHEKGVKEHCAEREAFHARLRGLIHPRFRVVSSTEKEPAHDEEPGELVEGSVGRDEER
jgi:hypothetical protein